MVEHFSDGDMFDCTLEPGWAPFTGSGLAQWGPPVTKDFLGTNPRSLPHEARSMISALRADTPLLTSSGRCDRGAQGYAATDPRGSTGWA